MQDHGFNLWYSNGGEEKIRRKRRKRKKTGGGGSSGRGGVSERKCLRRQSCSAVSGGVCSGTQVDLYSDKAGAGSSDSRPLPFCVSPIETCPSVESF